LAREGLLVLDATCTTVIRDDLDLDILFGNMEATHGKNAPATAAETYEKGDPVTIQLFKHGSARRRARRMARRMARKRASGWRWRARPTKATFR
jgi:hypothetical protein